MKKITKILSFLMALALVFACAACGNACGFLGRGAEGPGCGVQDLCPQTQQFG